MESVVRHGRRAFIGTALAGTAAAAVTAEERAGAAGGKRREFYEIKFYKFTDDAVRDRYGKYLSDALIPALKKMGIGPVGVFIQEDPAPAGVGLITLLPVPSLDLLAELPAHLAADSDYVRTASSILPTDVKDTPYSACESRLLRAFASAPRLKLPAETIAGKGRRFQLRTYVSPSEAAGLRKIDMFEKGEMAMFVRAGLQPVLYAQSLAGIDLPSLTYMVTFPDGIESQSLWKKFSADPEYKRLFGLPEYQGVVNRIMTPVIRPTPYSQI